MSDKDKLGMEDINTAPQSLPQDEFSPTKDPYFYPEYQIDPTPIAPPKNIDAQRSLDKRTYDPEILEKMKKAGLSKPVDCTNAQWNGPKRALNPRQKLVAYFAAQGVSTKGIAKETNLSQARVSTILATTRVKEYVNYLQYKMFGKTAEQRFKEILPKAIDTAEEMLSKPGVKDHLKAEVAFKFMDRVLGKPKQQIEHSGSLIKELFDQLDQLKQQKSTKTITLKPGYGVDTIIEGADYSHVKDLEKDSHYDRDSEDEKDEIDLFVQKHLEDLD